jgi:energy-coupling factor transport system substrate-specific component
MLARLLSRMLSRPSVRFLVCGGIAAAVNWLARFPLSLVLPFEAAVLAALGVGMVCGFLLYRRFVWPEPDVPLFRLVGRFIAVNLVNAAGILVVTLLLAMLLGKTGAPLWLAEGAAHAIGIAAGAVLNYVGHSRITFAKSPPEIMRSS